MKKLVRCYPAMNMEKWNFFNLGVLGVIDLKKKFDRESSSKVSRNVGVFKLQIRELQFYLPMP